MRIINRTIYGSALQTALMFDIPLKIKENTTLNEKFGILENYVIEDGVLPTVKYFCIGNRGHKFISGSDDIPYPQPIQHKASDAALYNHTPFILREIDNDLTVPQRAKYGLRKKVLINGLDYYAYYLKRIDMSLIEENLQHVNVENGQDKITDFVPDITVLEPQPANINNDTTINTQGNYLSVSALLELNFEQKDVEELMNVAEILYGSVDKAIVSEIGLCSGIDTVISGELGGRTINYTEVALSQIVSFITGFYSLNYSNQGFNLQIEAGATEPLLGIS